MPPDLWLKDLAIPAGVDHPADRDSKVKVVLAPTGAVGAAVVGAGVGVVVGAAVGAGVGAVNETSKVTSKFLPVEMP